MHKKIAKRGINFANNNVLDFGCGNLNHIDYEKHYDEYDIVEPFQKLFSENPKCDKIRNIYSNIHDIKDRKYDRIFSIAVLEHLEDLPRDVARCCLLMNDDGVLQAGIPCEGELGWSLGWRCSTAISFKMRFGLDYDVLMKYEHLNTIDEIVKVVRVLFDDVTIRRSPFPMPIKQLSFYAYIEAKKPRLPIARALLETGCHARNHE